MATVALTKETFDETIEKNDIVIIDFWADWCGPCKSFAPVYEATSAKHPDIVFAKVDTEAQPELAAGFQIKSIPTLLIFREQIGIFMQPGSLPAQALEEIVGQVKALDMEDVRKEMANHEHGEDCDHD